MVFRARIAAGLTCLALSAATLTGCGWIAAGNTSSHGKDTVATASPGDVQTITVTAGERMRFDPNVIHAHPGKLKITLRVTGPTPHDLEIPTLNASTGQVVQDRTGTIEVTLAKPGRVDFDCSYHVKHGMTGYITVS